eukprot:7098900-Ditylum_brightwellii.AAC.1
MTQKHRHVSAHNWITRVVKLNNYLMEFHMPPEVVSRKLDQEELLEVLEKEFPPCGSFGWTRK